MNGFFKNGWLAGATLVSLCALMFWWRLGALGLIDPDEPFYAQTAHEMVESGDWLTPHIFGEPQFEKPILYYWMVAASYKMFGENEFAGRFFPALFATLLVFLTWRFGTRLFNTRVGFLGAVILASCIETVVMSRMMLTDIPLAFFILGSLYAFWRANERTSPGNFWWFLCFCSSAFAVLMKGPLGLSIPLFAILLFSWRTKTSLPFRLPGFWLGIIVFFAIAAPWYGAMLWKFGQYYFDSFFIHENVGRILNAEHTTNNNPLYYIGVIFLGFIPWLPLIALVVHRSWRDIKGNVPLLFLWSIVIPNLLFFTIASSKLPSYIFFLFPVFALLGGKVLDDVLREGFRSRWEITLVLLLAIAQVVGYGVAPFVNATKPFILSLLLTAVVLGGGTLFFFYRRYAGGIAFFALANFVFVASVLHWTFAETEAMTSARPLAAALAEEQREGEPIIGVKFLARGVHYHIKQPVQVLSSKAQPFYTPHPIPIIVGKPGLDKFLKEHGSAICAVRMGDWEHIQKAPEIMDAKSVRIFGKNVLVRLHDPETNKVSQD